MSRILFLTLIFLSSSSCTKKEEAPPPPVPTPKSQTETPVSTNSGVKSNLPGIIRYKGKITKTRPLSMHSDPVCAKQHGGTPVSNEPIKVDSMGGLEDVFIYLKAPPIPQKDLPAVSLNQLGCEYVPHVLGLQVGQTLRIINSDPTLHNVHSFSKANENFNLGMSSVGQVIERKFTQPETMIRVKCDVHSWMQSYIGVLDHPFFAVSKPSGEFEIRNIPVGKYDLVAWHEKLGEKTQEITISEGSRPPITIEYP